MAAHGIHEDSEAVLCSGCEECEWRSRNLEVALSQMEPETIERAWRRMLAWKKNQLVPNEAERRLLEIIHAFAVLLSRRQVLPYGIPPEKPRPGFRLTLELGDPSMSDAHDVSIALQDVVLDLRYGLPKGVVSDRRGKAIGAWSLSLPHQDAGSG